MPQDKKKSVPDNLISSIFTKNAKKSQGAESKVVSSIFSPAKEEGYVDNFPGKDSGKIKPVEIRKELKGEFGMDFFGRKILAVNASAAARKKIFPIGVDIGTNFIKILRLGQGGGPALEIEKIIVKEIPREAQDNPEQRERLLPKLLKSAVEENNLRGDCFACLPHNMCKVNLITLPRMPLGEIDKALRWEIRQSMREDISQLVLDYIPLERQENIFQGNKTGLLTVTAPKKGALQYLGLLKSAGLNVLALDNQALANFEALEYSKSIQQDELILFLDFGAGQASLSIVNNGELIFIRQVDASGNALTKAISQYCKAGWDEAEDLKKKFGLSMFGQKVDSAGPQDISLQVRNAILPLLENMVQDIEQVLKYFFLQVLRLPEGNFKKLILSGGASNMNSFAEFLRTRLGIETQFLDVSSEIVITDNSYCDNYVDGVLNVSLNSALGLVLRGL